MGNTSKVRVQKVQTLHGHKGSIYALDWDQNQKLFTAGAEGSVAVWNISNPELGTLLCKMPNSVYALKYLSSNQLLVGQNMQGIHLIDLQSRQEIKNVSLGKVGIFDIKVLEDDKIAYIALSDGSLVVLDLSSFEIKEQIKLSDKSLRKIAFHPNAPILVLACSDHTIIYYDLLDGRSWRETNAHDNSVFAVSYNHSGTELLSVGRDAKIKVWTSDTKCSQEIAAHMGTINDIAFSPNKLLYATASMDKTIKVWNAKTHQLLKVIDHERHQGHINSVNKILWTGHDSLASVSDDRTVSIWTISL